VTLEHYLYAVLHSRSSSEAAKYSCAGASLSALVEFRDNVTSTAEAHGAKAEFAWTVSTVQAGDRDGSSSVEIEQDTSDKGTVVAASTSEWEFAIRDNGDGWRVCGARQVG